VTRPDQSQQFLALRLAGASRRLAACYCAGIPVDCHETNCTPDGLKKLLDVFTL